MNKIPILIVDDHPGIRERIRLLLNAQPDLQVIDEAASGEEAVEKALRLRPGLVVMDIAMPGINGIEATRRIKKDFPDVRVLALTTYDDEEFYRSLKMVGASGYILKEAEPGELVRAIRAVIEGQTIPFTPHD